MELSKLYNEEVFNQILKIDALKNFENTMNACKKISEEKLLSMDRSKLEKIKGADIHFIEEYNKFVSKNILSKNLIYYFAETIYMTIGYYNILKKRDNKAFQSILETKHIRFSSSSEDRKTGNFISISLNDKYQFEIRASQSVKVIHDGKEYYTSKDVENTAFKNVIVQKEIVLKTGNLLINDWFRTENNQFTDFVKFKDSDINSAKGRIAATNYFLENHNFICVYLSNNCPQVDFRKGKILIGEFEDQNLKSVCTDLWAASIIEEETLVELLLKSGMSKSEAKKSLKDIKKKWTTIQMKVKPGTYVLNYCGSFEDFNAKYKRKNKDHVLSKKEKVFFTLEKK